MFKNLFNKIPKNTKKIALFGTGASALAIKNAIENELNKFNNEIKIVYYIDDNKSDDDTFSPVVKLSTLAEIRKDIDLVIITTRKPFEAVALFKYYDIPYIIMPYKYDELLKAKKYKSKIDEVLKLFNNNEDKELYKTVWKSRINCDYKKISKIAKEKFGIDENYLLRNYDRHYIDYVNKEKIEYILDCGFCNGIQTFGFCKHFKNLKKIIALEPLYDILKNKSYDELIKKLNIVEIIPCAAWDKKDKLDISINGSASAITNVKPSARYHKKEIPTISIDELCEENNIKKVDFIKMDIEGAEMNALRGGGSIVKKHRPQLAISIYHSDSDFINIPIYLSQILENYTFRLGHYSYDRYETLLYAIPNELL